MPEFIFPLAVEVFAFWWKLTPDLLRDIVIEGIDAADVEPYEVLK